ncbi:hypothetical protein [Candidatus Lokiarchaeum ossiferum]|uniref:hypothetical protein n=1 Tax=Candidatus Lokiarchaeum ossiferum TaxID=2951803 RepID=UPI00352D56C9
MGSWCFSIEGMSYLGHLPNERFACIITHLEYPPDLFEGQQVEFRISAITLSCFSDQELYLRKYKIFRLIEGHFYYYQDPKLFYCEAELPVSMNITYIFPFAGNWTIKINDFPIIVSVQRN